MTMSHVSGAAGDIHQDNGDDLLSFSVSFNASVMQLSTKLGLCLFSGLGYAALVVLGRLMIFSGHNFHRGMPLYTNTNNVSSL